MHVKRVPKFSLDEVVLVVRTDTPEFAYYVARHLDGVNIYVSGDYVEIRIPMVGELYSPVDKLVSSYLEGLRSAVQEALREYREQKDLERLLDEEGVPALE